MAFSWFSNFVWYKTGSGFPLYMNFFLKFSQRYGEEKDTWKTLDITRGVVNILLNRMRCCYWHEERQKHNPTASPYSTLRLIVSSQEPITLPSSLCFSFTFKLFLEQGLYFKTALKSFINSDGTLKSSAFSFYWLFGVLSELEKSFFFETKRMLNPWLWKRPWSVRKTFTISTGTQQYNYMGYCGPSVRAGYWPSSFFEY